MAKISANHATEKDRFIKGRMTFVYTSDGRVLKKHALDGSYKLMARRVKPETWDAFKAGLRL